MAKEQIWYLIDEGDNLTNIASLYNTTIAELMRLNPDIKNPDLIYAGESIVVSGEPAEATKPSVKRAKITAFGLKADTENTIFATWVWSMENTESYQVNWTYMDVSGNTYVARSSTISIDENDPESSKFDEITMPETAIILWFKVKPLPKKETNSASGSSSVSWNAGWSMERSYCDSSNVIPTPSSPTVKISDTSKYYLEMSLDNIDSKAEMVEFEIIQNNTKRFAGMRVEVKLSYARWISRIELGSIYKVRCRFGRYISHNGRVIYGDWSSYTNNVQSAPITPKEITKCRAVSKSTEEKYSVELAWTNVISATSYEIEYATDKYTLMDGGSNNATTKVSNIETPYYEIFNLSPGYRYFFRIRAVNSGGSSEWTEVSDTISVVLGGPPDAPTTWSSAESVIIGEPLTLYWVHNSEDGSSQTYAEITLYINDIHTKWITVQNTSDPDEKDKTSKYSFDTTEYEDGDEIRWYVRTAGVTNEYGDGSIVRSFKIYAPPTLSIRTSYSEVDPEDTIPDIIPAPNVDTLTTLPFYIKATAGPQTQAPIGYYLSIVSNEFYETVDETGYTVAVNEGDAVYSQHFDISTRLNVCITAAMANLVNNQTYTIKCTAAMNSGLTAEAEPEIFTVGWSQEVDIEPNAEIGADTDECYAFIRPYCLDDTGAPYENVYLSIYRREFDGTFTPIAEDIANSDSIFIVDPHPALDYARYRIIAVDKNTSNSDYYDLPAYPIGCNAVVIQWDEEWMDSFDSTGAGLLADPIWAGQMLKLPYNIDISDKTDTDVSFVEYAGRKYPVSYYGTQLGHTSTWNVVIPKEDVDTIYALRRLAIWTGDVYVREPSGTGYWANIRVSFSLKHLETTIPVTIEVTRVEGGM